MSKKSVELPNIEDATLRACLAPLVGALHASGETTRPAGATVDRKREQSGTPVGLNDNPLPAEGATLVDDIPSVPDRRSTEEEDAGVFRTIELFLAMTEAELNEAAATFPRQVGGTLERISRIKRRLATQYDIVTTAASLLERALVRARKL